MNKELNNVVDAMAAAIKEADHFDYLGAALIGAAVGVIGCGLLKSRKQQKKIETNSETRKTETNKD